MRATVFRNFELWCLVDQTTRLEIPNQMKNPTKYTLSMFALALLAFSTISSQLSTLHAQTTYIWNGGSGDWSVTGNWTPASGPPGASDTATVNSGAVTVSADTTVATFNLGGGTLNGGAV